MNEGVTHGNVELVCRAGDVLIEQCTRVIYNNDVLHVITVSKCGSRYERFFYFPSQLLEFLSVPLIRGRVNRQRLWLEAREFDLMRANQGGVLGPR